MKTKFLLPFEIIFDLLIYIPAVCLFATEILIFMDTETNIVEALTYIGLISFIIDLFLLIFMYIPYLCYGIAGKANPSKFSMISKIVMIPYYVMNFIIWFSLVLGFANPFLFLGIPLLICLGVVSTFLVMMRTSIAPIIYTIKSFAFGKTHVKPSLIISMILQCMFVLDVVGSIIMFIEYTEEERG